MASCLGYFFLGWDGEQRLSEKASVSRILNYLSVDLEAMQGIQGRIQATTHLPSLVAAALWVTKAGQLCLQTAGSSVAHALLFPAG